MMSRRKLEFLFQEHGLVEAIAFGPGERRKGLVWAYAHFVLEEKIPRLARADERASLTRRVLQHALANV